MISLIAAIGKNRELGRDNQLIFHIPEDMQFFKATTLGHPILMGAKTFASIGRPLPGRQNYVATRHPERLPIVTQSTTTSTDTTPVADPSTTLQPVLDLDNFLKVCYNREEELFVIGGAMIYQAALPYATTLYLTEIEATAPDADAFFPAFDPSKYQRTLIKKGKDDDLAYSFVKYTLI